MGSRRRAIAAFVERNRYETLASLAVACGAVAVVATGIVVGEPRLSLAAPLAAGAVGLILRVRRLEREHRETRELRADALQIAAATAAEYVYVPVLRGSRSGAPFRAAIYTLHAAAGEGRLVKELMRANDLRDYTTQLQTQQRNFEAQAGEGDLSAEVRRLLQILRARGRILVGLMGVLAEAQGAWIGARGNQADEAEKRTDFETHATIVGTLADDMVAAADQLVAIAMKARGR